MKKFEEIAAKAFNIKVGEVKDDMTSKDIKNWDSMNYLMFISEVEKEFNVSFTMDEVLNAKSLGDIRKILESRK